MVGRGGRAAETAARKQRLLAAAAQLAAEGGYDAVQMRDVAARADVALGTLYRHYPSKDHLLVSALAERARALQARLARTPPAGGSASERVACVLASASRALEREPKMAAAMVAALSSTDSDAAEVKEAVGEALRGIILGAIGVTTGADGAAARLDDVVHVLGHVWFSVLRTWVGDRTGTTDMGAELGLAARLLLDPHPDPEGLPRRC
jgi:AcrR family transcriptional regulator